jgi:hypothetical protein
MVVGADIVVGAVEGTETLTVKVTPVVAALQPPLSFIRTQYVVVTVGVTVRSANVPMMLPPPIVAPVPH